MRVTTLVNKLIGLQGLWVRGFHFQADKARVVVDVVPRRRKPLCGICGRKVRKNKDRYNRYWRHLDLFGVRTYLRYSIRRVVCRRCGVVREKVPWADKGSRFTKSFEQEVAWLAQRSLLVERRGSLIFLAPAVHFRRAIELLHALIGLGGLTVGAAMLVAACGVEIIPRFFVDFGGSKRIATEEKLHRRFVFLVLLVKILASHPHAHRDRRLLRDD